MYLQISTDLDNSPWDDLKAAQPLPAHTLERIGLLPAGMASGRASVALVATNDTTGEPIIIQASWAQLNLAVHAIAAGPAGQREEQLS